jgi:CrcB protein
MLQNWPPLGQLLAVLVGGAVGSVARFMSGHFLALWLGANFPWGTLFVNVVGSLWLGWIGSVTLQRPGLIDPIVRLALTAGFAGGFTTFSSLAFESIALFQRGDIKLAFLNLALNFALGVGAAIIGVILARLF